MSLRRTTMRNAHRSRAVLTINPERSWLRLSTRCHVRGPALLSMDEGAPDPQLGREHAESARFQGAIADAGRDRSAAALLSGDARSAVYWPTFTEGTSGRKKYQKKVIA